MPNNVVISPKMTAEFAKFYGDYHHKIEFSWALSMAIGGRFLKAQGSEFVNTAP
jgi:hypothetical protein